MKNECVIVTYHYVHDETREIPNVYTKTMAEFVKQLYYLKRNYDVISLTDYVAALNNQKQIPERTCVITFDDGLLDHYENVAPTLKQLDMPGTFFVSVAPFLEKKVMPVQMLQSLLGEVTPKDLIVEYHRKLKELYPDEYKDYIVTSERTGNKIYIWYKPEVINLKYTIGRMTEQMKRNILEPLFEQYIGNQEEYWNKFYMKSQHIKELNEWGFEIGNHGYTHSMLTELNDDELYHELFSSKIIIEQTTRTLVKSFSIPYGSYNDNVIGKIKYFGYTCCLNSDFKVNTGRADPFALTRMDPKLIPEE